MYRQYAGYDYSQQGRFVPPDMMQPQQTYTGQIYQPTQAYPSNAPQQFYGDSFEEEPPLLEGRMEWFRLSEKHEARHIFHFKVVRIFQDPCKRHWFGILNWKV